jgi:hypothetical protein
MIGLLGIPFTPSMSISSLVSPLNPGSVVLIVGISIFLAGIIKHALIFPEMESLIEPWMRLFHGIALFLLALSPWISLVTSRNTSGVNQIWWPSIAFFASIIVILVVRSLIKKWKPGKFFFLTDSKSEGGKIYQALLKIVGLQWLLRTAKHLGKIIESAIFTIVRVMEGDGGILWSFLFVVLIASLLLSSRVP